MSIKNVVKIKEYSAFRNLLNQYIIEKYSSFIEDAVQSRLFDLTVKAIKQRTATEPADTIMETIRDVCRNTRSA